MSALLYIATEGVQGGPFQLTEGTHVIGSTEGATILIPDTTVSAQHGQLTVTPEQIVYQDLGSQNGSFIQGQPITQPIALTVGHTFRVGNIDLTLGEGQGDVESMKRETAVLASAPKAIEPGDFGSGDSGNSAFKTRSSGWVKIYIIAITVIGVVAVGALVVMLYMK